MIQLFVRIERDAKARGANRCYRCGALSRHAFPVCAVPGRCSDDAGLGRRPDRPDVRRPDYLPAAGSHRQYQGLCGHGQQPLAGGPGDSNGGRGRIAGFYCSVWSALFAPKGTPSDIVAKLNAAAVGALAGTAVRERLAELGQQIVPREEQTPEALAALQRAEIEKWWPIIRAAGIRAD
jgi:hypothetical protein